MKRVKTITIVEVTIEGKDSPQRTAEIARVKQKAHAFGATEKYFQKSEDKVTIGFTGDSLEALAIVMNV